MTASSQGEATGMFYVAPSLAAALDTLNDYGPDAVSYTHLTLPTILRV